MNAQIIDLGRARQLREELQRIDARNAVRARVTRVSGNGQLSLDPLPGFHAHGGIEIDGMQFTCTSYTAPTTGGNSVA